MANSTGQMMPHANNATLTTGLIGCSGTLNVTQAIKDLYDLYQNTNLTSVSNVFSNVSINQFNCTAQYLKHFQQIITFTSSVSIHVQIDLASIYYDYVTAYGFLSNGLNGFLVDRESKINLSSITLNYSAKFDACSSGIAAQDPLCPQNSGTPICFVLANPWIFNCSAFTTTSTTALLSTTSTSSVISPWQIGLICGLGLFFLLILFLIVGYCVRRRLRSKNFVVHSDNVPGDVKSLHKSGIPSGQAFQRTATVVQPKQNSNSILSVTHQDNHKNVGVNEKNCINLKPAGPHHQGTFLDHAKVRDPVLNPADLKKSSKPILVPNDCGNALSSRNPSATTTSRPVSGTSIIELKLRTDGLVEGKLDESDIISLDRPNSSDRGKTSTPIPSQKTNNSSVDESLHDEDAWMPILAVANAELDALNRLEREQKPSKKKV